MFALYIAASILKGVLDAAREKNEQEDLDAFNYRIHTWLEAREISDLELEAH